MQKIDKFIHTKQGRDTLLIAIVAVFAIVYYIININKIDARVVRVYSGGALVDELSIVQDTRKEYIYNEGEKHEGYNIIEIMGGTVSVVESDCKGGDCVRMGATSKAGDSIVCLPHRFMVVLVGEPEVDTVTGH